MRPRALATFKLPHPRGQALVETAILLPILLILLLGAIDFGRLFFGYVNLHQAVRIGANFAATHPNMDVDDRLRYEELINNDIGELNCQLDAPIPNPSYTDRDGTPVAVPVLGDYANLTLECDFSPVTPLGDVFFGDPIAMAASSTFPIRLGCVNCPDPPPAEPPPTPLQCRLVPDVTGYSVAGARLAWQSAGFDVSHFVPVTGQDTETVESYIVIEDDPLSTCEFPTEAIFSSDMVVTTADVDPETPPTCLTVPNMIGMELGDARDAWTDAEFTGTMTADGGDPAAPNQSRVVVEQTTDPASEAGVECRDPATTVNVVTGDAWPTPPIAPCKVPSMINLTRPQGQAEWVNKGFSAANFSPSNGNFTIRSQTLTGSTYVPCTAVVSVSASAN